MNQPQGFPELHCAQHNELIKGVCMFPDCNSRYMCRQCRKIHPNSHLNEFEDLEEILSGRLADDIHKNLQTTNQQIEEQERISQNNSHTLITSIEGHFNQIQNHIMQKLNETRELIIQDIKNKFKENTAVKQEIQNHSGLIYENFTTAQANNFNNVHQLNNLITSLCNAQVLRTKINNDPELQTLQRGDLASSYFTMLNRLIDHFRIPFDKLCHDLTNAFQINRNPYQNSGTQSIPRIGSTLFENIRFEAPQFNTSFPTNPNRLSIPKGIRQPEQNLFQDKNAYPLFNTLFQNQGFNLGQSDLLNQNQGFNLGQPDLMNQNQQRFNIGQPDVSTQNQRILPTLLTPHNSINPQAFPNQQTNPSPFKLQTDILSSNLMKAAQEQLQLRAPQNSIVYDPTKKPPSNPRSQQPTPSRLSSNLFAFAQAKAAEPEENTAEEQEQQTNTVFVNEPPVEEHEENQEEEQGQEIVTEETNRIIIEDDEGNTEEVTEVTRSTMQLEAEEEPVIPKDNAKKSVTPMKIIEIFQRAGGLEKKSANSKVTREEYVDFGRNMNESSGRDMTSQVTFGNNSQQLYDPEESVRPYLNNQRDPRRERNAYNPGYNNPPVKSSGYTSGYQQETTPGNNNTQQNRATPKRETIEQRGYLQLKDINISSALEYIDLKAEYAIGGTEGTIQIWNANPRERIHTIKGHNGEVFMLKYIKEKGLLLSCSADGDVGVWNTKDRYKSMGSYKRHDKLPVYCMEYLSEFDEMVSAGEDGVLRFWKIEGQREVETVAIPNATIYSLCYLQKEKILLAATEKGMVHVVTLSGDMKKLLLQKTHAHDSIISKMQYLDSKGNKVLITGSYDGYVKVWTVKEDGTLEIIKKLGQPGSQIMGFIVIYSEGLIVTSHDDGHIRLWRGAKGNDKMLLSKQDETFGQNILYFKGHHNYNVMLTGNKKLVKLWGVNFENLTMKKSYDES